jgi:hypothetical protein
LKETDRGAVEEVCGNGATTDENNNMSSSADDKYEKAQFQTAIAT